MNRAPGIVDRLWELFQQLRRRRFAVGAEEFADLRRALGEGFGWESRDRLRALCCALWATSPQEMETLRALFDRLPLDDWELPRGEADSAAVPSAVQRVERRREEEVGREAADEAGPLELRSSPTRGAAPPELGVTLEALPEFVWAIQQPMGRREAAQSVRRLRRPIREGPPEELDLDATLRARARCGTAVPPVLVPRRRNRLQLLLLVDRQGSMDPYHAYCDSVVEAIRHAGGVASVCVGYFHDTPAAGADESLLDELTGLAPILDPILPRIEPLEDGIVYRDPGLTRPEALQPLLGGHPRDTATLIVGDAGAARGNCDPLRLLDTVAFLKAMRRRRLPVAWLNPAPRERWQATTAGYLARHVPQFPLDRPGLEQAVDVLRGRPFALEAPV